MPIPLSIKIGNFLYQNCFSIYNIIYPIFKKKQDKNEIEFLKSKITPNFIMADIGANIGFYTKIFSELVGTNGEVHAFEPESINFNHLKNNTSKLKNVTINQKAVSNNDLPIHIYKSKNINVDHRTYPTDDYESMLKIEAISLDTYFKNKHIDFIKMDIQGYELMALQGMEQTIKANPKLEFFMEFWPYGLQKAGFSVSELYHFANRLAYKIKVINNNSQTILSENDLSNYEKWPQEQYANCYWFKYE